MATYKGKTVTVREINPGDKGYDKTKPQVIIVHNDGKEETVPKDQVQALEGEEGTIPFSGGANAKVGGAYPGGWVPEDVVTPQTR